jgi:ribosomal protein S18 acetylase RimI-like enzyme
MQKHDCDGEGFRAIKLRPVVAEDESFMRQLFATTREDEFSLMLLGEDQKAALVAMQFKAQSAQYAMSYPHAENNIILLDEVPIGKQIINRGESEFTLVDIALLPPNRGIGIGTHLIEALLAEAESAGKSVALNVWHSNPAKKLYERMGFQTENNDDVYCEMRWSPAPVTPPSE